MAYTYASNLNGTYETILKSVQQIFSADADLFTGFSSNPSYLFADNLRQTMHNYAEFLEGALWLYGAVIVGNDLSEIAAISLPLSAQDANYLSTRTNGFDTAINYLTTNLKMQPAPLANLTTSGPLIGDPGFETYFSQLDAEVAPSNLLSVQGGTLTDFAIAPLPGAVLTWENSNSEILPLGTGDGSTTTFETPTSPVAVYKSDWQGNQLQYSTPRTNLSIDSLAPTSWGLVNTTVANGTAKAPDGIDYLGIITATATGNSAISSTPVTAGSTYILSVIAYPGTSSYLGMLAGTGTPNACAGAIFNLSGPGILISTVTGAQGSNASASITLRSDGTYKCTLTFTSLVTVVGLGCGVGVSDGSTYAPSSSSINTLPSASSGTIQASYFQTEIGNVATSFIPTTTTPVTVTDYSLKSSLGVYGVSQDETNGWSRIRTALLLSGTSYPPNLADTLTFMQNIQQKVTNYGVTYAPTLSNNFPVSAIWNYAICVWTYQDMAAIYSNLPDSQVIQNIQILRYILKQVELQCAELLTAYRTQVQIPPNTSPLLQSDSLMDLANRALGDYTQWVNIATANGLLPPYTYPTPAPNIASPGTQLFMPGSSTPTNLGNYLLNFLGTDLNWGIPLQSMPVWTGDFETVVGYTNLRWALARRILTPLNSLIYHPEYGSYLSQYLGQPLTNLNLQLILSYTSIALLNDPRIASIVNLTPALTEVNTLLIQASVQPLGIGVTPTQINLTLQPSAISVT